MACIWKHPKSVNWIARYRGAAGKTVNRSTGTPDRNEAELTAQSWQIEAARERQSHKPDISHGGISDTIARAERLARQGRLDAAGARNLVNQLLKAAGQESLDAVTSRKWCDGWVSGKNGAVKAPSHVKYQQVCRDWLSFLGNEADRPMEILRGIYSYALEQGYIGRNPFVGVSSLREKEGQSKRLPFTTGEVEQLISAADGEWKGLVILAATSGLRLMDGVRLRWGDINMEAKSLQVKTAKTGATLVLPLHSGFLAWLKKQQRGIGAAPVFSTLVLKSGAGKSGLSMAFKRLMVRAKIASGVARQAGENGRGRTTSQKSFHSLRHFAATQLASAGVRAEVARQITGHTDSETHANYINADVAALRLAVKSIRLSA